LVEVTSPHENVSIVKRGDSLVIDVDEANESVHVSVPLKLVSIVAGQIGRVSPPKGDHAAEQVPSPSATL
jgi:hypothetical protein